MENRARDLGILGTGVLYNGTGNQFHLVSSGSEPGRVHVVETLPGMRFACDCKGYRYRGRCAHIAAVFAFWRYCKVLERQDKRQWKELQAARHAQEIREAQEAQDSDELIHRPASATDASHGTGYGHGISAHPGDTALPRRNNRPFSLLK